ncbi:hypothetical protein A5674_04150 [Mycobacterium malmoense]|nr:hypothetical protein A5674_04150 [Mycobacterium malmoense]
MPESKSLRDLMTGDEAMDRSPITGALSFIGISDYQFAGTALQVLKDLGGEYADVLGRVDGT